MSRFTSRAWIPLASILLVGIACDSADNPVAPSGTVVTVSASPSSVDTGGTSTVTVVGIRSDGNPAASATASFTTSIGTLSSTSITLDPQGLGTVVFTAPGAPGTATIIASVESGNASVAIEVTAPASQEGQVSVRPTSLELDHSRTGSGCDDPLMPRVRVRNQGPEPIDFRILANLPDWLTTDVSGGAVPGRFQVLFTCDVPPGDQDLAHILRVQGVDPATGDDVGDESTVEVEIRVRD